MLTDTIAILAVFSVPLAAIFGATYIKAQRLRLQAGGAADPRSSARLAALEATNAELRARIETLETIVTSDDLHVAPSRVRVAAPRVAETDPVLAATEPASQRALRR